MIEFTAKNGYKIIKISLVESTELHWGNTCDRCIDNLQETRYYIPILNFVVCKKCTKEWGEQADFYEEDLPHEEKAIERLKIFDLPYEIDEKNQIEKGECYE